MNINNIQKRYLLIISFALVLVWLIYDFINHKDNFYNLTGFIIGLAGLLFTIEDKRNTKITKAFDDISLAIREVKTELKTEMQSRDNNHDHRLTELTTKVAFVEHKLELHREQFGHPQMISEVYSINEKISDLNANVALLTQQGRVAHQLDAAKVKIDNLEELVRKLLLQSTAHKKDLVQKTGVLRG
jgi:hypothetical protein